MGTDAPADTNPRAAALAGLGEAIRLLDRGLAPRQKTVAFARAGEIVTELDPAELASRVAAGTLTELDGIGPSTGSVISDAVAGRPSVYLAKLERNSAIDPGVGAAIRERLRGDCHSHTTWSDGGAPVEAMARAAMALGHDYLVVTDHSPRLTIAHGLSPERLAEQLTEIEQVNERLAPFRILTGMEVDILVDGSLDLPEELLSTLDVVVASVHSKLSMPEAEMTRRMVLAAASPHVDILGHCTGRKVMGGADRHHGSIRSSSSQRAPSSALRSRSIAGPNGRIRPRNCWPSPSSGTASSRSTPMRTPRASWSGSPTDATRPSAARCPSSGSSIPGTPTNSWTGRPHTRADTRASARSSAGVGSPSTRPRGQRSSSTTEAASAAYRKMRAWRKIQDNKPMTTANTP